MTTKSFTEVVPVVEETGGIAVPAHVDGENGLFKLQGTTLAQALECGAVFAMEVVDPACTKPSVYISKKLGWTELVGSDAHHPSGASGPRHPGSHFTWVKMGTPSLEGLRLALLDGPLSVRRSDEVWEDPNKHAALVIEAIEVSQARYMGRSTTFKLELNPWLNAIIGGRGTGKSTGVEFLRLALRREAELPEALAGDFERYRRCTRAGTMTGYSLRPRHLWSRIVRIEPAFGSSGASVGMSSRSRCRTRTACGGPTRGT